MPTVYPDREPLSPITVADTAERINELISANQETKNNQRVIRDIMNGGAAAVAALLGDDSELDYLPAANMILQAGTHLAYRIGTAPDLRVDPVAPRNTDAQASQRQKDRADKIRLITDGYDEYSPLEVQLPQVGRWLPGYGYAVWVHGEALSPAGDPYPRARLRDPYSCYPGQWGFEGQPPDLAILYQTSLRALRQEYADLDLGYLNDERAAGFRAWPSLEAMGGSWANQHGGGMTVAEYYDRHGVWRLLLDPERDYRSAQPDRAIVLDHTPHPPGFDRTMFTIVKRFSFDQLGGAFDGGVGMSAMQAQMYVLMFLAMHDGLQTPVDIATAFPEEVRNYEIRRGAWNVLPPDAKVTRTAANMPYQIFAEISQITEALRAELRHPVTNEGRFPSPSGFQTGVAMDQAAMPLTREVSEYHTVLRRGLADRAEALLWLDEARYPDRSKPFGNVMRDEVWAGSASYTPATDIAKARRVRYVYGVMAGMDEPQKVVVMLQLFQAGMIPATTVRENLKGLESLPRIEEALRAEGAEAILTQMLTTTAQDPQADPMEKEKAKLALLRVMEKPKDFLTIMQTYFGPEGEGEELTEPEVDQLGMTEAPPNSFEDLLARAFTGGGGGPAALGSGPEASQTVLSRLEGDGGIAGGVQTVAASR